MSEFQPDLLGGKGRPGRRTPKIRRGSRPRIVPAGHADTPGSGPAGETCGSCTYMRDYSYKRTYHKCGARPGDVWKGGRATDVRPLDAACSKWAATVERINGQKATILAVDEATRIPQSFVDQVTGAVSRATIAFPILLQEIVDALSSAPGGLTTDEVADKLFVDRHAVRPRISELAAQSRIEKTGDRRMGSAGRSLAVWILKGTGND